MPSELPELTNNGVPQLPKTHDISYYRIDSPGIWGEEAAFIKNSFQAVPVSGPMPECAADDEASLATLFCGEVTGEELCKAADYLGDWAPRAADCSREDFRLSGPKCAGW